MKEKEEEKSLFCFNGRFEHLGGWVVDLIIYRNMTDLAFFPANMARPAATAGQTHHPTARIIGPVCLEL